MTTDKKEYNKKYYEENKEREQQRSLEYYHKNKDKIDKEKKKEYHKQWYKANKHKIPARTENEKEERNRKRRERYANDKDYRERTKAKVRAYNKRNPRQKINNRLQNSYGITLEEFEQLLIDQNNCCAICGTEHKKEQSLHVDHNHNTGEVRGLLCHNCNFGIGHFQDDFNLLIKASEYIKSSKENECDTPLI